MQRGRSDSWFVRGRTGADQFERGMPCEDLLLESAVLVAAAVLLGNPFKELFELGDATGFDEIVVCAKPQSLDGRRAFGGCGGVCWTAFAETTRMRRIELVSCSRSSIG